MIPNNTWSIRIAYCSAKLCSCVTIDNFALDLLYSMAQKKSIRIAEHFEPVSSCILSGNMLQYRYDTEMSGGVRFETCDLYSIYPLHVHDAFS